MEIDRETILLMSKETKSIRNDVPQVLSQGTSFCSYASENKDDADDVCQLIFLKIWNKREKFTDVRDFDSYLLFLPNIQSSTIYRQDM